MCEPAINDVQESKVLKKAFEKMLDYLRLISVVDLDLGTV